MHYKIWMISCLDGRLEEKDSMQEAEAAVKDGNGWLSLEELKAIIGE